MFPKTAATPLTQYGFSLKMCNTAHYSTLWLILTGGEKEKRSVLGEMGAVTMNLRGGLW